MSGARFALVVGNGSYAELGRLKQPASDAQDMVKALEELGFTVEMLLDADLPEMKDGLRRYGKNLAISADSIGFFFYAGYGARSGDDNYLIPSGTEFPSESLLRTRALSAQTVLDTLRQSGNGLNLVVIDAYTDIPFPWRKSRPQSELMIGNQPDGSIVLYAASAEPTAQDGAKRNGIFVQSLLRHLKTPGLEIKDAFNRSAETVKILTGGKQTPEVSVKYSHDAYLSIDAAPQAAPSPVRQSPSRSLRGEIFVQGGMFSMGNDKLGNDEKPVHGVRVSGFWMMKTEVTQKEFAAVTKRFPSSFLDGDSPVEQVSWFDAIRYANALSAIDGLKPVYQIGRTDVKWDRSANGWRLPTEAEWEYAARGGQLSQGFTYAGGSDAREVAWHLNNAGKSVKPVGLKAPNELGIYDLSGNVWEWCWDWYGGYGSEVQSDPTGAVSGVDRVFRGGGWDSSTDHLQVSFRGYYSPNIHYDHLGFRLVRW